MIPSDGEIIEGIASVDESAITGESAPVIREAGGDRSAVTGGTRVLSDEIVVRITARPGETFLDRMIALVEGANRQKTPNEIALNTLLAVLTIIFLLATVTLQPFAIFADAEQKIVVLVALLVCLIPTTIGALLSAIGIAGMDRLVQHNVLAMSGRAVEAAGDCSTLLLDKTGTITLGNRQAAEFLALPGRHRGASSPRRHSSRASPTRPPRVARSSCSPRSASTSASATSRDATLVPFTAQTRMSGLDLDGTSVRKGAADSVKRWVIEQGGTVPDGLDQLVEGVATGGGTPLVVAEGLEILGVIHLKDIVKEGIRQRFDQLRAMGIRTVMITGDNPLTAQAIATEAGVDDFLAEATPEDKMDLIRREQAGGRLVAMTGDGTNDAPALAQADVGVAMNTGTQAAKEAGNMVDLDSNPTKLIEIVEIGKQLLITRGSLTTFSIANDVAKYFAIIPAMFSGVLPVLDRLNVMDLETPRSAILSAVIFNALIIVALIPLSLRGVKFRAESAAHDAAPQPADLRRSAASSPRSSASSSSTCSSLPWECPDASPTASRSRDGARVHRPARPRVPARRHRHRGSWGSTTRPTAPGEGRRPGRRFELDRPAVHRPEVLPPAPVGRRLRAGRARRRRLLVRLELRAAEPGAHRQRAGRQHPRQDERVRDSRRSVLRAGADDRRQRQPRDRRRRQPRVREERRRHIRVQHRHRAPAGARVPRRERARSGRQGAGRRGHVIGIGLDPQISVANARLQAPRVAEERNMSVDDVLKLVDEHTDGRALGFLGEPGVNVLELNLALDQG